MMEGLSDSLPVTGLSGDAWSGYDAFTSLSIIDLEGAKFGLGTSIRGQATITSNCKTVYWCSQPHAALRL